MIDLIDQETGRRARCAVIFHGQAAAEITADALETWARKVRRLRLVRRALTAAGPACVAGLFLATPSPFACGLYVSDAEGVRVAWVADDLEI